jgi:hypothetical protein
LILAARVKAGWITEADLAPEPVEGEDEDGASPDAGAETGEAATPNGASA